jgi:type II protein arginine methyltransferase
MLNDTARNAAFRDAIARQVTTRDRVVDIGAGTGLLSILAARAGAMSVDAFEGHPDMAAIAARTIESSDVADRIALHRTWSTNVHLRSADRRDLLVTETFDCALIGEGILPTLRHARNALLTEGYRVIPRLATLSGALLASPRIRRLNEVSDVFGVDVSHLNELQTKGHFPVRLSTWPHVIVSDERSLLHLDLREDPGLDDGWEVAFRATRDDVADGIVAWFSMDLGAGIHLSTRPDTDTHWMQAFVPFPRPLPVRAGESYVIDLSVAGATALTAVPRTAHFPDFASAAMVAAGNPTRVMETSRT